MGSAFGGCPRGILLRSNRVFRGRFWSWFGDFDGVEHISVVIIK